jgi:hypothetical protein
LLKELGFRDLQQVETAISRYNDDILCEVAIGSRQGQVYRFELMLLAALGKHYIERHPLGPEWWLCSEGATILKKFQNNGIPTSVYDPKVDAWEAETNR